MPEATTTNEAVTLSRVVTSYDTGTEAGWRTYAPGLVSYYRNGVEITAAEYDLAVEELRRDA